ncbi:MmgE/PrpD family protein [Caenimonas soli]|uniref:MmgE/PrpD family protein n=1 Tax=Caenimonas soli TaxID=2735555 RepID=UPI001557EC0D|nr:MmgE/PrpD family protein [Caenimonas soli]NPC56960.1 MmgE/PrpD family protein [Caenimonas soli]
MTATPVYPDAIERFLDLILDVRYEDLPAGAIEAGKIFFLDTVGVACAGKLAPKMADMLEAARNWGGGDAACASVWNTSLRTTTPVAALLNGYQCHALEYDCVYEPGVILPTPPLFAALMARAEQLAAAGKAPTGKELLRAFIVGLEVSCTLALASRSAMFFFRPATTGVFSALAALACLSPLPRDQLRYAFGIGYSQMCGPMQAHEEGSMMLAMQMGFAARNAVQAYDMAAVGITAPVQVLEGRFGFYRNFESESALPEALAQLGAPWKVTQLSHKPFPSGRVTHGAIHALRVLQAELQLARDTVGEAVRSITVRMPPLGMRLVGRPMISNPPPNYARLCVPFVAASELLHGNVDPSSFVSERLGSAAIEALARKVRVEEVAHPNPNAFYPQHITLELADGRVVERDIPYAWGHPLLPLSQQEREDKFRRCLHLTRDRSREDEEAIESMIGWVARLPEATDCAPLLAFLRVSA